jgi:hypothetical protein
VNVAVVTTDGLLVGSQRSDRVRMAPGVWNSSVDEGMSRHIDSSGRNAPDVHAVARRGVREELSLEPHEYALELLAFALDVDKRHWSAHFCARLKDLTREGLQARMSRGVADRWEHQTIDHVPFHPAAVVTYMLRADRIHRWAPLAPALFPWPMSIAARRSIGRRRRWSDVCGDFAHAHEARLGVADGIHGPPGVMPRTGRSGPAGPAPVVADALP